MVFRTLLEGEFIAIQSLMEPGRSKPQSASATTSAIGPLRLFAAMQRDARNAGRSRRSVDAAGTAALDPERPLASLFKLGMLAVLT
jgi:hypothetical protein